MTKSDPTGVILIDKPPGPTSHDVVARVRRVVGSRRVGHTGTLDPFASGLLVLCVGSATRIASLLSALPKRYDAEMTLGTSTTTDDPTGTVVATSSDWTGLDEDRIRASLVSQVGTILQRPPVFSAKKLGGERLYRLARDGQSPAVEPVRVVVHELEVTAVQPPMVAFSMACSSGTYVRAIARDAGERLGVPAHLHALRRTAIGDMSLAEAAPLDGIADRSVLERAWRAPLEVLGHMPRFDVDARGEADLKHGRRTPSPAHGPVSRLALAVHEDRLVALVESVDGWLQPRRVFS